MPIKSVGGGWAPAVVAKTADYTCVASDCGTLFTNTGAAGTVTFTLPKSSAELLGWNAEFVTTASQAIAIASSPTDTLVVHGDAAADSVTTAATIGQHFRVTCVDGSKMFVQSDPSAASAATAVTAVTIAT